jgi:hypothetical protein
MQGEHAMSEIRLMTFQESLDLDLEEFESAVIARYMLAQPNQKASERELEELLTWAHASRTDGAMLDGLLRGDLQVKFEDDDMSCRLISGKFEPDSQSKLLNFESESP